MTCAILFDEENCDDKDGFQEVPVGFTKLDGQGLLGTGNSMDDDAESVMVNLNTNILKIQHFLKNCKSYIS